MQTTYLVHSTPTEEKFAQSLFSEIYDITKMPFLFSYFSIDRISIKSNIVNILKKNRFQYFYINIEFSRLGSLCDKNRKILHLDM